MKNSIYNKKDFEIGIEFNRKCGRSKQWGNYISKFTNIIPSFFTIAIQKTSNIAVLQAEEGGKGDVIIKA